MGEHLRRGKTAFPHFTRGRMGAGESSLVDSVSELSSVLDTIEKKIASVETCQVHVERTVTTDGEILIADKRIACDPSIELIVGPIVGLITQTTARLLVETSNRALVTFNVFIIDEFSSDARFFYTKSINTCGKNKPLACTLTDLTPNTRYGVYIGGCSARCVTNKVAVFYTLPTDANGFRSVYTYKSFPCGATPGESDIWKIMSKDTVTVNATTALASGSPHICFHLGGYVSTENLIRIRGLQLFDLASRSDVNDETIENLIEVVENELCELYRDHFSASCALPLLRGCGNLFVCGQDESAMQAINLLAVDSEIVSETSIERFLKREEEAIKEKKEAEKVKKRSAKKQKSSKTQQNDSDIEHESDERSSAMPPPSSTSVQDAYDYSLDDPSKGDSLVPAIGGVVRREKESLLKAMESKRELQDEVRRTIVSLLLRVARRTYWAYMRQLWDEYYVDLMAADTKDEIVHRTTFFMSRGIERSEILRGQLEITSQKLKREFGSDFSASINVDKKLEEYTTEVFNRKKKLREYITEVTNATGVWVDKFPKDVFLDLGSVGVIVTDLNWGWLLPDGVIKDLALSAKEVGIHFSVFDALQVALGGKQENGGTVDSDPSTENISNEKKTINRIILLCPTAILPLTGNGNIQKISSSFFLSKPDSKRLLGLLASWQQEDNDRAALIAFGCDLFAGSGHIRPLILEDEDGYDPVRSKLLQISVGGMLRRPESTFPFSDKRGVQGKCVLTGFESQFDCVYSENSFWDVSTVQTKMFNESTGEATVPASYALSNIKVNSQSVDITVGPIIGKVTASSVCILLESANNTYLTVIVADQVTGKCYALSRYMQAGIADTFFFDCLYARRTYEVLVFSGGANSTEKRLKVSNIRGSFTTAFAIKNDSKTIMDTMKKRGKNDYSTTMSTSLPGTPLAASSSIKDKKKKKKNKEDKKKVIEVSPNPIENVTFTNEKLREKYPLLRKEGAFRILVVGANRPSWSHTSSSISLGSSSLDGGELNKLDRMFLLEGSALVRDISEVSSRSWNEGFDIVVHVGYNVDLSGNFQRILSTIFEMECCSDVEIERKQSLRQIAMELMCDCYRIHWGSTVVRPFLSHNSHMLVTSTLLDLLSATNSSHMKELERDMTPFALQTLYEIAESSREQYQERLWRTQDSKIAKPSSVSYLCNGEICAFTITPQFINLMQRAEHLRDHYDDHLISEHQFSELEDLLFKRSTTFKSLLIISPLPVLRGDPDSPSKLVGNSKLSIKFCKSEIIRLLDLLSLWVQGIDLMDENEIDESEEDSQATKQNVMRDVTFLTGGSSVGYRSRLEVNRKSDTRYVEGRKDADAVMQQVCCGSLLSIPETVPDSCEDEDQILKGTITRDVSFIPRSKYIKSSLEFQYKVFHSELVTRPHCGVIEMNSSGDVQRITSGPSKLFLFDRDNFKRYVYSCPREVSTENNCPVEVWKVWMQTLEVLQCLEKTLDVDPLSVSLPSFCSESLKDCLMRIRSLLSKDVDKVNELHQKFASDNFYVQNFSGTVLVVDLWREIVSSLLQEIHTSSDNFESYLLKSPSSMLIYWTWIVFRKPFEPVKTAEGPVEDADFDLADRSATSYLISELHQFRVFCHRLVYVSTIFETFSYDTGFHLEDSF